MSVIDAECRLHHVQQASVSPDEFELVAQLSLHGCHLGIRLLEPFESLVHAFVLLSDRLGYQFLQLGIADA
jgi:hypothetical protein